MAFIKAKRTMGVKLESTPYTAETLANTNYNIPLYDIEYNPEIEMYARKIARGHMSWDPSISGKRALNISVSHDFYAVEGELDRAPAWGVLQQISGCLETTHGSTGVSYIPHSDYTRQPATVEIQERNEGATPNAVVITGRGAMANCRIMLDSVGRPFKATYDIKAVLVNITDRAYASIVTPSIVDTDLPDAVLSSTITLFGETQKLSQFTIDYGNNIELFSDPARPEGYEGAHVTERNPNIELDPDLELIASRGDFARWTGDSTGAMLATAGSNFRISAPAVQYIKAFNPAEREGHITNTKNCELKGVSGNDEFEILQGAKA